MNRCTFDQIFSSKNSPFKEIIEDTPFFLISNKKLWKLQIHKWYWVSFDSEIYRTYLNIFLLKLTHCTKGVHKLLSINVNI